MKNNFRKVYKPLALLMIGSLCILPACAQPTAPVADATNTNLEPAPITQAPAKPVNPAFKQVADVPRLPRVLLIGDSISMGYTLPVRAALKDRANVHRPAENCGPTERGVANLDMWLGSEKWDVIHFNFGLHDLKYLDASGNYVPPSKGTVVATPDAYAANLRKIVARLKQTGARLIFATTTPVPPGTLGRIEADERVYNAKAVEVMKENGVDIDDLGAYMQSLQAKLPHLPPKPKKAPKEREGDIQIPYNVHFTKQGYTQLGDLVVESILRELPPVRTQG